MRAKTNLMTRWTIAMHWYLTWLAASFFFTSSRMMNNVCTTKNAINLILQHTAKIWRKTVDPFIAIYLCATFALSWQFCCFNFNRKSWTLWSYDQCKRRFFFLSLVIQMNVVLWRCRGIICSPRNHTEYAPLDTLSPFCKSNETVKTHLIIRNDWIIHGCCNITIPS